jgi:transcriptional regulator with GAF, ATPase, and Fis domain
VDIRIIAATNRDLLAMVKDGTFREDLYFRLNVFPITIPPLRHRISDIPALLNHFIKKTARRMKLKESPILRRGALSSFLQYDWPGNIRELENLVERAMIINPEGPLEFNNLLNISVDPQHSESDHIESLDVVMRRHIMRALDYTKGRISGKSGAAKILKIHPNTLRSRMNKLGINYQRNKSIIEVNNKV